MFILMSLWTEHWHLPPQDTLLDGFNGVHQYSTLCGGRPRWAYVIDARSLQASSGGGPAMCGRCRKLREVQKLRSYLPSVAS